MIDQTIEITSASRARRVKRRFTAVLTIEDPALPTARRVRFHRVPHPAHLVLAFEDLDTPTTSIITASREQIAAAIEFGRANQTGALLVHCHAGISRSTAVALAIIADRLGSGQEKVALAELLNLQAMAVPNLQVVALADDILGREGRLLQVVTDWDSGIGWNQHRRKKNREAVLQFYGEQGHVWSARGA